jgi:hypothetical protein
MHNFWARINAVLTFFGTVAAALCVLVTLTDYVHQSNPQISLQLKGVKRLAPFRSKNDQAVLSMALDADLRSAFSWNTKQLFVFVQAEYETAEVRLLAAGEGDDWWGPGVGRQGMVGSSAVVRSACCSARRAGCRLCSPEARVAYRLGGLRRRPLL